MGVKLYFPPGYGASSANRLVRRAGVRLYFPPGSAAPSNYIAGLAMDGWWRSGQYSAGTGIWVGTASAGSSGSRNLAATNASGSWPTAGANLNGLATVSFSRASAQRIVTTSLINTFIGVNRYLLWALVKQNSASGASAKTAAYGNNALISDANSYFALATSTTNGGVAQAYQWDTAGRGAEQTLANGSWALVQAYYDGANINMRVNSGLWQTAASGSIGDAAWATNVIYLGCNYTTGVRWDGLMADVGITKQISSNYTTVCDGIKTQLNTDYGLSL